MDSIKYKKFVFERYILNNDIIRRCKMIAQNINSEYHGEEIVFVGLLEGCFPFMSTILNFIDCKHESTFLKISSYKRFKKAFKDNKRY